MIISVLASTTKVELDSEPNKPVVPGVPVNIALTDFSPTLMFAGIGIIPNAVPFSAVVRIVVICVPTSVMVINWPSTGNPVLSINSTSTSRSLPRSTRSFSVGCPCMSKAGSMNLISVKPRVSNCVVEFEPR